MISKPQIITLSILFIIMVISPSFAVSNPTAAHTLTDIIVNNDPDKGWVSFEFEPNPGNPPVKKLEQRFPDRIIITLKDTKIGGDLRDGLFYENLFSVNERGISRLIVNQINLPPLVRITVYLNRDVDSKIDLSQNAVATLFFNDERSPDFQPAPLFADASEKQSPTDYLDELIRSKVHEELKSSEGDIDKQFRTLEKYKVKSDAIIKQNVSVESGANYRIQAGDKLDIVITDEPEFRASVKVRPDGYITYQLIGDVVAEGLTPGDR